MIEDTDSVFYFFLIYDNHLVTLEAILGFIHLCLDLLKNLLEITHLFISTKMKLISNRGFTRTPPNNPDRRFCNNT